MNEVAVSNAAIIGLNDTSVRQYVDEDGQKRTKAVLGEAAPFEFFKGRAVPNGIAIESTDGHVLVLGKNVVRAIFQFVDNPECRKAYDL